jgi:hypothetical protein
MHYEATYPTTPCLAIHDSAVKLAPTPMARFHAANARAAAINAADEAEFLFDPAAYRLRADYHHNAALDTEPDYHPSY